MDVSRCVLCHVEQPVLDAELGVLQAKIQGSEKKKGQRKKPLVELIYSHGLDAFVNGVRLSRKGSEILDDSIVG